MIQKLRFLVQVGGLGMSLFVAGPSHAAVEVVTDAIFSGKDFDDISVRSRIALGLGERNFHLGAVGRVDYLHSYVYDLVGGAGFQAGKNFFFQMDGGFLLRKYESSTGTGIAAGIALGKMFGTSFRISLPLTIKYISSGLMKRWSVDYVPYLGFRFGF